MVSFEVLLAPGEMVWYESAKLVHGRLYLFLYIFVFMIVFVLNGSQRCTWQVVFVSVIVFVFVFG